MRSSDDHGRQSIGEGALKGALAARRGVTLSSTQKKAATLGVYTSAMTVWGAVFGAAHARFQPPALVTGLALGVWLYALNFPAATGVLPKLGVLKAPAEQSRAQAALPIGAHVAFGVATAVALDALS